MCLTKDGLLGYLSRIDQPVSDSDIVDHFEIYQAQDSDHVRIFYHLVRALLNEGRIIRLPVTDPYHPGKLRLVA